MKTIYFLLAIAVALSGCARKTAVSANDATKAPTGETTTMPPNHPPVDGSGGFDRVNGTILETMNGGGYTYIRLKTPGGEEWTVVNDAKVEVGQQVTIDVNMVAQDFESKSLNRKFDKLIFGNLAGNGTPAAGDALPGHGGMTAEGMKAGSASPESAIGDVRVPKAEGADAKTSAEIWAARQSLKDHPVVMRGKVVKFLPGIMGKNWIHLQDGSGSAAKGDNDITVTTKDSASPGDVVVVRGIVRVDQDFGAGYTYPVIIEEAKVSK